MESVVHTHDQVEESYLMPTTTSGIYYPSSSDAPRVWEDMQEQAESVEALYAGMGQYTNFDPQFTGFSAFGTGYLREGWYCHIGKICFWGWRIEFGATGSPAFNAEVQWSLADTGAPYNGSGGGPGASLTQTLGSWTWRGNQTSLRHWSGTVGVFAAGGNTAFLGGAYDGTVHARRLGSTTGTPPLLANSDVLTAAGVYRLA
jgi:hypothetical protein